VQNLQVQRGKLNKVAIAKGCGFSGRILYTYPSVIEQVNELINGGNGKA